MAGKPARRKYVMRRRKAKRGKLLLNKGPSLGANGIPEEMFIKVKYTTGSITLNGLAGVPQNYTMRGNDCFDPDLTGTGHQPYMADQMFALYSRYVVHASKIRVRASCGSTNEVKLLVRPSLSNAAVGNYELEVERPDSKNCLFSTEKPCTLKHYAKTKTVQGVKDLNDTIFHGSCNTGGPTSGPTGSGPWYWVVAAEGIRNLAYEVHLQIELVFYVKLFKRAIQAQS